MTADDTGFLYLEAGSLFLAVSPVIESTGCTAVDRHRARHELDVVVVGKDGW